MKCRISAFRLPISNGAVALPKVREVEQRTEPRTFGACVGGSPECLESFQITRLFPLFEGLMHFVYILYSLSTDRYYVGESVDVEGRRLQHNTAHYPKSSTKFTRDWEIMRKISVENPQQARIIEKYIKGMKSKRP